MKQFLFGMGAMLLIGSLGLNAFFIRTYGGSMTALTSTSAEIAAVSKALGE